MILHLLLAASLIWLGLAAIWENCGPSILLNAWAFGAVIVLFVMELFL